MVRKLLLKYNINLVLLVLIFAPLVLAVIYSSLKKPLPILLQADYQLTGVTPTSTRIKFSFHNLSKHKFQHYAEDYVTNHLPLRSFFIRLNNQFYYSIFKKSYNNNGGIIIGKSRQLFTDHYILTYCDMATNTHHNSTRELIAWADKIKLLNDYFKKHGQVFLYLITPSKAAYMPDKIPTRFHCQQRGEPLYLQTMIKLLDERKIPYIDGQALMSTSTNAYQTPMFPRGGIHWNELGASIAANKIIEKINQTHPHMIQPLTFNYQLDNIGKGHDRDLLNLLNLSFPNDRYTVPQITFNTSASMQKPISLVFVGGSFCERLIDVFLENNRFNKITYMSYFKMNRLDYEPGKEMIQSNVDLNAATFLNPVINANVVILEENTEITVSNHGQLFFDTMNKKLNLS